MDKFIVKINFQILWRLASVANMETVYNKLRASAAINFNVTMTRGHI